jgi:hypothetical protein
LRLFPFKGFFFSGGRSRYSSSYFGVVAHIAAGGIGQSYFPFFIRERTDGGKPNECELAGSASWEFPVRSPLLFWLTNTPFLSVPISPNKPEELKLPWAIKLPSLWETENVPEFVAIHISPAQSNALIGS